MGAIALPRQNLHYPGKTRAGVVKLVNTRDLKSLGFGLAGSSPATRTILLCRN
jgi:hypothetical protein